MNQTAYKTFWVERWKNKDTGFHLCDIHPDLQAYFGRLSLKESDTVFIPLCGKTLDIHFFLQAKCKIIAVEMVELAVQQLFENLQINPQVSAWKHGKCYQSKNLTVYVGNVFDLSDEQLNSVNIVYDRAAFIALPYNLHAPYSRLIKEIANPDKQMLITVEFDASKLQGPPFLLLPDNIKQYYGNQYQIELLHQEETINNEPNFQEKGLTSLMRKTYLLSKFSC